MEGLVVVVDFGILGELQTLSVGTVMKGFLAEKPVSRLQMLTRQECSQSHFLHPQRGGAWLCGSLVQQVNLLTGPALNDHCPFERLATFAHSVQSSGTPSHSTLWKDMKIKVKMYTFFDRLH